MFVNNIKWCSRDICRMSLRSHQRAGYNLLWPTGCGSHPHPPLVLWYKYWCKKTEQECSIHLIMLLWQWYVDVAYHSLSVCCQIFHFTDWLKSVFWKNPKFSMVLHKCRNTDGKCIRFYSILFMVFWQLLVSYSVCYCLQLFMCNPVESDVHCILLSLLPAWE